MDQLIAKEPLQQKVFHLLLQEHRVAFHLTSLQEQQIPRKRAGMQRSQLIKEALEENEWTQMKTNHSRFKVQAEHEDHLSPAVGWGATKSQ